MPVSAQIEEALRKLTEGCGCENPNCHLNYATAKTVQEVHDKWMWIHDNICNMQNLMLGNLFELARNPQVEQREEKEEWVDGFIEIASVRIAAMQMLNRAIMVVDMPRATDPKVYRLAIAEEIRKRAAEVMPLEIDLSQEQAARSH